MKRYIVFFLSLGFLALSSVTARAQGGVGAGSVILNDGNGNTVTVVPPAGLQGSYTWTIPINSNGQSSAFVNSGTTNGSTLSWDIEGQTWAENTNLIANPFAGGLTLTTGDINANGGALQTAGTTRIDNSGNATLANTTIGGGTPIVGVLSATASLSFPATAAQSSSDLTIALTGANVGDCVNVGVPNGAVTPNSCYTGWVSAAGTVTVRFNNYSSGSQTPAATQTFRVSVVQF